MRLRLTGNQREQLHLALLSAFPTDGSLRQMLSFKLNINLPHIVGGSNFSEVVFNLIEWAEARGRLQNLITAARADNPDNPDLLDFDMQTWQPLNLKNTFIDSKQQVLQKSPNLDTGFSSGSAELSYSSTSEPLQAEQQDKERMANVSPVQYEEVSESIQATKLSNNLLVSAHSYVTTALNSVHSVYDLFLSEEDIYEDQCHLARTWIKEANEAILEVPKELAHIPAIIASLRYELVAKQQYFRNQALSLILSINEFSQQPSSLNLQEEIQDKLNSISQRLQEIDVLIDLFGQHVDKSFVINQLSNSNTNE